MIGRTAILERVEARWDACIVAATGPSLTSEVAATCRKSRLPIVAVSDAIMLVPWAEVVYSCDAAWWDSHRGCGWFQGEKWSSHSLKPRNDKTEAQAAYGLRLVAGADRAGFSLDPGLIHYGGNSGFQAINLAILMGAEYVVLVGFDLRGNDHFFGRHPPELDRGGDRGRFIPAFEDAARMLPGYITIVNATPGSALTCFPMRPLAEALCDEIETCAIPSAS